MTHLGRNAKVRAIYRRFWWAQVGFFLGTGCSVGKLLSPHSPHLLDSIAVEGTYQLNAVNEVPLALPNGTTVSRKGYALPGCGNLILIPPAGDTVYFGPGGTLQITLLDKNAHTFNIVVERSEVCGPVSLGSAMEIWNGPVAVVGSRGDSATFTSSGSSPFAGTAKGGRRYLILSSGDSLPYADTLRVYPIDGAARIDLRFVRNQL